MAGIVCINIDVFVAADGTPRRRPDRSCSAFACAVGALGCWTWFAVENTRYLQRHAFQRQRVVRAVGRRDRRARRRAVARDRRAAAGRPAGRSSRKARWHSFWALQSGFCERRRRGLATAVECRRRQRLLVDAIRSNDRV